MKTLTNDQLHAYRTQVDEALARGDKDAALGIVTQAFDAVSADLARVTAEAKSLDAGQDLLRDRIATLVAEGRAHKARADAAELALSVERERGDGYLAGLEGKAEPRGMTEVGLDAFIRADKMRKRADAAEKERDARIVESQERRDKIFALGNEIARVTKNAALDRTDLLGMVDNAEAKAERLAAALRSVLTHGGILERPGDCIFCNRGSLPQHLPGCPLPLAHAALSPITPAPVDLTTHGPNCDWVGGLGDGNNGDICQCGKLDADRENSAPRVSEVGARDFEGCRRCFGRGVRMWRDPDGDPMSEPCDAGCPLPAPVVAPVDAHLAEVLGAMQTEMMAPVVAGEAHGESTDREHLDRHITPAQDTFLLQQADPTLDQPADPLAPAGKAVPR